MKTLLTLCLSFIALSAFAQPPQRPAQQPPPPPNAPPTAGAPAQPGAPAQQPPGGPAQQPPAGMPPGAPGMSPAGPAEAAAPGATITATLTPAATAAPTPEVSGWSSNFIIDNFRKGGPIMWPILLVSIVALTVVIERIFWWGGRWFRRDPKRIEKV